jgi:hypothetical protein
VLGIVHECYEEDTAPHAQPHAALHQPELPELPAVVPLPPPGYDNEPGAGLLQNLGIGPINWDGMDWEGPGDANLTRQEEAIIEELICMTDTKLFDDARLFCYDGEDTAPRVLLALAYPSLYSVLRGRDEEEITLLMPQFRRQEVQARIWGRLTRSLEVKVRLECTLSRLLSILF